MKKINIICPECGEVVYRHDGKSVSQVVVKCHNCKLRYRFNPETFKLTQISDDKRTTSSGMRFY